jgi:hypothetical protein
MVRTCVFMSWWCPYKYRNMQQIRQNSMRSIKLYASIICVRWCNIRMSIIYCHDIGVCVNYRRGLDWMIGFIDTLYTPLGTAGNYSAVADLHTLHFTVAYTLVSSDFTIRILATDISLTVTAAHMKSSSHSLIPFLPSLLDQSTAISRDSIPHFNSSASKLISWQSDVSKLNWNDLLGTDRTENTTLLLLREFISAETCLPNRSIATAVRVTSRIVRALPSNGCFSGCHNTYKEIHRDVEMYFAL